MAHLGVYLTFTWAKVHRWNSHVVYPWAHHSHSWHQVEEVALLCYVACSHGPFLIWTTERSPFQSSFALFHLPFHCKFFLCQEVFLNFVRVSELPKYLVHLPDGIYRVTSPILKNKHMVENPRDGVAWGAAVYGVAQSRTRLKQLSSSSHFIWKITTCTMA